VLFPVVLDFRRSRRLLAAMPKRDVPYAGCAVVCSTQFQRCHITSIPFSVSVVEVRRAKPRCLVHTKPASCCRVGWAAGTGDVLAPSNVSVSFGWRRSLAPQVPRSAGGGVRCVHSCALQYTRVL